MNKRKILSYAISLIAFDSDDYIAIKNTLKARRSPDLLIELVNQRDDNATTQIDRTVIRFPHHKRTTSLCTVSGYENKMCKNLIDVGKFL